MSVCICTVECLKWVTEVVEIVNSVFGCPSSILYNVSVCVYAHMCVMCVHLMCVYLLFACYLYVCGVCNVHNGCTLYMHMRMYTCM